MLLEHLLQCLACRNTFRNGISYLAKHFNYLEPINKIKKMVSLLDGTIIRFKVKDLIQSDRANK